MVESADVFLPRLLRVREVADYLGVSVSTAERLIADDAFAGGVVRFRRTTRIKREALSRFLEASTDEPAGDPTNAHQSPSRTTSSVAGGAQPSTVALVRSLRKNK